MEFIRSLIILILLLDLLLLLIGMIQPTVAVWWEDVQNRRRVLKIYGTSGIILLVLYLLTLLV